MIGKATFAVLLLVALTAATHHHPHKCHGHHCRDQDDDAASDAQQRLRRAAGSTLAPVVNSNGTTNSNSRVSNGNSESLASFPPVIRVIRAGGQKRPASSDGKNDNPKATKGGDGGKKDSSVPKVNIQPATPQGSPNKNGK